MTGRNYNEMANYCNRDELNIMSRYSFAEDIEFSRLYPCSWYLRGDRQLVLFVATTCSMYYLNLS